MHDFFKHKLLFIFLFIFFSLVIHKPSSDSIILVSKYSLFHVVRDDILGLYFGMKFYYDKDFSQLKKQNFLLVKKRGFFSVCQLKKKIIDFYDKISSQNIIPDDMKKS